MAKQYLWTVGEGIEDQPSGTVIADRYLLKTNRIVVDTRPELLPDIPSEISDQISPYLKLFAYRLHIPQVYGVISPAKGTNNKPIILLEKGPIANHGETLMPTLAALWPDALAMRQLNWLWQIAQLWQPLTRQEVASSLLNSHLLRVQGRFVRLLQLDLDIHSPTLKQLGYFWQQWVPTAQPQIQKFLQQLTHQMISGELRTSTQLIQQLDQALSICGRGYHRRIEIAAGTDAGPTRSHNEDACYPEGSKPILVPATEPALAIVCDGIGGQDGGEVASSMAIDVLRQQVEQMPLHQAHWDPLSLTPKLKRATCIANDMICQRNDDENRQGRERMGTTLVMALAHIHEIYLTHLGDSRVYWISSSGCHQVTVDDDVASRQVRLGCALYRDALQQGASGALIQALGITSSVTLHPTVQRFPLDEDCVFLLCSDGLSDRDRVEQCWEAEILPVLRQEVDLATVRDRLIEIANTQNGHDNVTIALLLITVVPKDDPDAQKEICIPPVIPLTEDLGDDSSDTSDAEDSSMETVIGRPKQAPSGVKKIWFLSLGIAVLLGILGALLYGLGLFNHAPRAQPTDNPAPTDSPSTPPVPTPTASATSLLKLQSLIQLGSPTANDKPITLLTEFGKNTVKGTVPEGTVFQVQRKDSTPETGTWIEVKICSTPTATVSVNGQLSPVDVTQPLPSPDTPAPPSLGAGNQGWLPEQEVNSRLIPNFSPVGKEKGKCVP
ncbi:MAG: protein phosphatase 2C domain-containing protein [Planktothrix sp. GU0601_MAG3]|nr:MAG: protein phosphatase 2C domain-containing protein [Planktothrix sp. GU0601_MAG3]